MSESKISQIKVGKHRVGIVGLEAALNKVSREHKNSSDALIAEKMLQLLSKKNYISKTAQDKYRDAFLRAFKKHMGLPVGKSESDWVEIKILGGCCNICDSLENSVMEALSDLSLPADVEHITEKKRIREYQVQDGPALVINREVVANGIVPSKQEIRTLLEKFAGNKANEKSKKQVLIKNIEFSEPRSLTSLVDYRKRQIVSRTFAQNSSVSITLFAFDKGEKISTHTAPGDAMLQVLEGRARVTIGEKSVNVLPGRTIVMPADIPHSVQAEQRFKMLLTLVKR